MAGASTSSVVNVYPLANYTFGTKEPKMEKDTSVADRLARMKVNYMKEGMRTSVEAILLVQEHNHPHILLLQIGNMFCKLPGGRLKPGENEIEGPSNLVYELHERRIQTSVDAILLVQEHNHPHILLLQIGSTFCKLPGGRLKPREKEIEGLKRKLCSKLAVNSPSFPPNWQECKKLFIVHLTEREYFAVPLFELL